MGCCGSRDPHSVNVEKRTKAARDAQEVMDNPNSTDEQKAAALASLNNIKTLLRVNSSVPPGSADVETSVNSISVTVDDPVSQSSSSTASHSSGADADYGLPDPSAVRPPAKSMMINAPRMSENPQSGLYKYRKIKQLADGGTCIVFKVQKEEHYGVNKVFYACKLLPRNTPKGEETSRRLWTIESDMLKKVKSHMNILQLHDAFEEPKYFVIVTAFYNGGELFEKLYEYAYSEKDAVVWMKQILYAIQSLHSNGIVHRDIKPENFVLDSQDRSAKLRLIDFGGALQGPDDMEVKDVVATPSFVAPEVLDEKAVRTIKSWKASDIWSCGVILYVLLAGALPFDGHSQREVFHRISTADYKLGADSNEFKLSYAARDMITKMLTLDWTKRPTVEECLVHPWISGNQALAEKLPERVFKSLVSFTSQNRLRKLVAKVLAHQIKLTDHGRLDGLFQKYDKDHDGTIGQNEAAAMLSAMNISTAHLSKFLATIDENGDGSITRDEFFFAAALGELAMDDAKIEMMFRYFDSDQDGYVTLADIVGKCGLTDEAEARKVMREVDPNGKGRVDYSEWRRAMKDVGVRGGKALNYAHRQSVSGYEFSPSSKTASQKAQEQQSTRATSKSELVVTSNIKAKLTGNTGISAANNAKLDAALAANPGRPTKPQQSAHKTSQDF